MKRCPRCGEDGNAFYSDTSRPDGLCFYCVPCTKRASKARRAKPAYAAARKRYARSVKGGASNWFSKHRTRHGALPFDLSHVERWFAARPPCCPYTGASKMVLHMNHRTRSIEGWIGHGLNTALPFMHDSLALYCEINGLEPPCSPPD